MPKLTVTARELRYGGKSLLRGEEFDATDKHAVALTLTGKAAAAPEHTPVRRAANVQPAVDAAPEPEGVAPVAPEAPPDDAPTAEEPAAPTASRRYNNRRLTSED